jgi:hypothetical protein
MARGTGAYPAPLYVGVQDGNSAVATVTPGGGASGLVTYGTQASPKQVGTSSVFVAISAEGTPPLPEPQLLSNSLTVSGEHDAGGTESIYVSELNQFPVMPFASFFSEFANTFAPVNTLGAGNQTTNTAAQVVETTYVTPCGPGPCPATDAFAEGTLLSTTTFTQGGGTTVNSGVPVPAGLTAPYATTEVYTITLAAPSGPNVYGQVSASIDLQLIPEPASIALLGTALAGVGALLPDTGRAGDGDRRIGVAGRVWRCIAQAAPRFSPLATARG